MERRGFRCGVLGVAPRGGSVVVLEQVRLGVEVPEEEEAGDGGGEKDEYDPQRAHLCSQIISPEDGAGGDQARTLPPWFGLLRRVARMEEGIRDRRGRKKRKEQVGGWMWNLA